MWWALEMERRSGSHVPDDAVSLAVYLHVPPYNRPLAQLKTSAFRLLTGPTGKENLYCVRQHNTRRPYLTVQTTCALVYHIRTLRRSMDLSLGNTVLAYCMFGKQTRAANDIVYAV